MLHFIRDLNKEVLEIDELMSVLKKEVESADLVKYCSPKSPAPKPPPTLPPPASALFLSNSAVKCAYCSDMHYSASCPKVKSPRMQVNIVEIWEML